MSSENIYKILLFSENLDLLSDLFFYAKTQNLVVAACNNGEELLLRAHRTRADVLLVDEDTYHNCGAFADLAKALKVSHRIRIIVLAKDPKRLNYDAGLVDEVHLLSKDIINKLFGKL